MKTRIQLYFEYFLIGILGVLPILLITQIVIWLESLIKDFAVSIWGRYQNPMTPVYLFALTIGGLTYVGYLIKKDKAYVLYFIESGINRIPLLGTVYRVAKKILSLFRGDEEVRLREVVYVEYPKDGAWVPAYVTNRIGDHVVVYVPTSPNPTSGFTIIIHEDKVVRSDMSIEEASSFVISLGVDLPRPEETSRLFPAALPPRVSD